MDKFYSVHWICYCLGLGLDLGVGSGVWGLGAGAGAATMSLDNIIYVITFPSSYDRPQEIVFRVSQTSCFELLGKRVSMF